MGLLGCPRLPPPRPNEPPPPHFRLTSHGTRLLRDVKSAIDHDGALFCAIFFCASSPEDCPRFCEIWQGEFYSEAKYLSSQTPPASSAAISVRLIFWSSHAGMVTLVLAEPILACSSPQHTRLSIKA